MKHIIVEGSQWEWSTDPFPAYRCSLVYGRNQRGFEFLPVQNIEPVESDGGFLLTDGQFRLIKTKAKGTLLIVPDSDDSNDLLLFVGCDEGFRGGASIREDATNCKIVKTCKAGNRTSGRIEVIAHLKPGQSMGFHTHGRRTNNIIVYTWGGDELLTKTYSKEEWELQLELNSVEVEESRTYFGFAVADGMFDDDVTISRTKIDIEKVREIVNQGVVPALNPRHSATVNAMSDRFGLEVEIPEEPPKVKLNSGDRLIVMSVRGLPRIGGDRAEYTKDEIDSAEFTFSIWEVS